MNAAEYIKTKNFGEKRLFTEYDMILFANQYAGFLEDKQHFEFIRNTMDFSKISNIQLGGVDTKDYPDFADAYIQSCDYDGEPATDEMLEVINEDGDFVYEQVMKRLH